MDTLVPEAVAADFVSGIGNLPDNSGLAFRDPPENKEGSPGFIFLKKPGIYICQSLRVVRC